MSDGREGSTRRAAVIVNPTKFEDVGRVRRRVTEICHRHGWAAPLWLETTAEDTGVPAVKHEGSSACCAHDIVEALALEVLDAEHGEGAATISRIE